MSIARIVSVRLAAVAVVGTAVGAGVSPVLRPSTGKMPVPPSAAGAGNGIARTAPQSTRNVTLSLRFTECTPCSIRSLQANCEAWKWQAALGVRRV